MKKFSKIFLGVFLLLTVFIFSFFAINATDESLSVKSQALISNYPTQSGYSLSKLKVSKFNSVPGIDFNGYQDYKKNQAELDKIIAEHSKPIEVFLEAFNEGHVEVLNGEPWNGSSGIFPSNNYRLFLAMLSQKVQQGKMDEALKLVEKANLFTINILETPQSTINKMIALLALNRNVDFVESLKTEGFLKKTPESLKNSFQLSQTVKEIYQTSLKYEFASVVNAIKIYQIEGLTIGITDASQSPLDPVFKFVGRNALRRNQTMNWLADIYEDLMEPACTVPEKPQSIEECSHTYKRVIQDARLSYYLINPVGRGLIRMFIPKTSQQYQKMETGFTKLNAKIAAL